MNLKHIRIHSINIARDMCDEEVIVMYSVNNHEFKEWLKASHSEELVDFEASAWEWDLQREEFIDLFKCSERLADYIYNSKIKRTLEYFLNNKFNF